MNSMADQPLLELAEALRPIFSRVRKSAYAVKVPDGSPACKKSKLTRAALNDHVDGGTRCGGYPVDEGSSTTRIAVFDLDSHKNEVSWPAMRALALEIVAELRARGAAPVAFRSSGGSGIHLYLLWGAPQDAYSVRMFMRGVLGVLDLTDGAKGVKYGAVECFPKQDAVAMGKYGNQVWFPLAGKSCPLDVPTGLTDLPRDALIGMEWPLSAPVTVLERPVREALPAAVSVEHAVLASALAAIPNSGGQELDYDGWLRVVMALHQATDASDEGLAMAHAFSSKSSKYDPDEVDLEWGRINGDTGSQNGVVTAGTILKMAREQYGWVEDVVAMFEAMPALTGPDGKPEPGDGIRPKYKRGKPAAGQIEAPILSTFRNVVMGCECEAECGAEIRYDEFRAEITVAFEHDIEWRPLTDDDYSLMRLALEDKGFQPISKELIRDSIHRVAQSRKFDSAQEWIDSLKWDGVPRIDHFIRDYFATPETPYSRAVGAYMWTALAGRTIEPGVKADMVPVLVGAQGIRKSSIAMALAPDEKFFGEFDLNARDADQSRAMRGVMVGELSELRGLHTKDAEAIKSFLSRRIEKWRPVYQENETSFRRRLLFIGTTNKDEFLADPTGERRWLPLKVERGDVDALVRDRDQLWAEGAVRFRSGGVAWADAERLARETHAEHTLQDGWMEEITAWLETDGESMGLGEPADKVSREKYGFTLNDVLKQAIRLTGVQLAETRHRDRATAALKSIGYVAKSVRQLDRKVAWRWVKKPD